MSAVTPGAIRLADRWLAEPNAPVQTAILKRLDDPDWAVRQQLAASLGALPPGLREQAVGDVMARYGGDPVTILEAPSADAKGEADLIRRLVVAIQTADPDVIENHNLHGFDLPFLEHRARKLRVPLALGRIGPPGLRQRAARRGAVSDADSRRRVRFIAPGRELVDSLDAVLRHDFSARDLPGQGLKAVAKHFGLAGPDRELIRGDQVYDVYTPDPDRVRRYATRASSTPSCEKSR